MRALLLAFALAFSAALPAAGWDQVTLFDWVYPGEPAYTALKQAAVQAQTQHWSVERLRRNEKVPQASARELARILIADPKVDGATKLELERLLASEGVQLGVGSESGALGRADALSRQLDVASSRIDEIETIYKTNNIGKGSTPSLAMELYSAMRLDNPGGLLQRRADAYMVGGGNFTLLASIDKVNIALGIGVRYFAGDNGADDSSVLNGYTLSGASFQVPLDDGGLDVSLGARSPVYLSPLLFGGLFQEGREAFFVDVIKAFRPSRVIKLLDLDYPAFTREVHALTVNRQGQAWYWPFSRTQFVYTPNDDDFWQGWNEKVYTTALRLDRELHQNSWMDPGLWYLMWLGSRMDTDIFLGTAAALRPKESVESYAAGFELRLVQGTQLKADMAVSNYSRELVIDGPRRLDADSAFIGTLVQPWGPVNLAFEAGMAGPRFLSSPQRGDRLQNGAVLNSMSTIPWPNSEPDNTAWVTFMKDPAIMNNNTNRLTLKGEWRSGFVGVGLYSGIIGQINPTDARVVINPVTEGRDDNGYGLFRMFGTTYAPPPPPLAVTGGSDGEQAQAIFNRPTDGTARYGSGPATIPVHWQEISQQSYREAFFSTWLTQNGVGDNRLLAPVAKTFNYTGTRLALDFGALFDRSLTSQLTFMGELRDLALQAGLPSLDASNLFSQNHGQAVYEHGVTEILTVIFKGSFEAWKSKQSFYAIDMQMLEWGGGFDLRLDPYVTGLQANLRATSLQFDDLNLPYRAFSLWTLSVGTTLTY